MVVPHLASLNDHHFHRETNQLLGVAMENPTRCKHCFPYEFVGICWVLGPMDVVGCGWLTISPPGPPWILSLGPSIPTE